MASGNIIRLCRTQETNTALAGSRGGVILPVLFLLPVFLLPSSKVLAQAAGGANIGGLNPALTAQQGSAGSDITVRDQTPLPPGFGLNQGGAQTNTQTDNQGNGPQNTRTDNQAGNGAGNQNGQAGGNNGQATNLNNTQVNQATGQVVGRGGLQRLVRRGGRSLPVPRPAPGLNTVVPRVAAEQQVLGDVVPLQGPGTQTSDPTPFDPLGIQRGQFVIRPSLEVATGFTSNSTQDEDGAASVFGTTQAGLAIESNFDRHALGLAVQGDFTRFSSGGDNSDLSVTLDANGRLDIDEDTSLTGAINLFTLEDDIDGVSDDPLESTITASLQLDHPLRQVATRSQVRISRNINGSFVDAAGVFQSQDDQNSTELGINLRGTLERGASLEPFLEADVSREFFDESTDAFGNERNVTTFRGLAGIEIDRGEKLNGEFAVGFGQNLIDGEGIEDFGAFLAEFNITWSPQRLTTVNFTGATAFDAFPSVGTPGDTTYTLNLLATRQVRGNLAATLGTGLTFEVDGADEGTDTTIDASAGLEWSVNRTLALTADYAFSREFSADGGGDFTSNSISLGFRIAR